MLAAGRMRERVDIEANTRTADDAGGVSSSWAVITRGTVWAEIRPLRGEQKVTAAQIVADATHLITIRYSTDVSAVGVAHRVKYGTRIFDIRNVTNINESDETIELLCVEQKP